MPGAQHHRRISGDINDCRLDADFTWSAVEHVINRCAELRAHMLRQRCAYATEPVRRRPCYAAAEFRQERVRNRMSRYAQADRILATGERITYSRRALEYHRQRPGPEFLCKQMGSRRHIARPIGKLVHVRYMHDHRMIDRSA